MTSKATILFSGEVSIVDLSLARLTDALGVQCEMVRVEQVDNLEAFGPDLCLMISAYSLAAIFQNTSIPPDIMARMFECVPFVLVYGITPEAREASAVRQLTEGLVSSVVHLDRPDDTYQVSATEREITQEFSGLTFGPMHPEIDFGLVSHRHQTGLSPLVSINTLPLFASFKKRNTRVFLLACREIADLEAPTDGSWPAHVYFSRLVPAMMFLQHVFQEQLWHNPKRYANLIIDDPLLRESYGFLHYARLLQEMDRCEFTTTMAFIPWNYKRTSASVARMFKERADRFSICLHGCDHTEGEFADTEPRRLNTQIHLATQRMRAHEQSTGLPYAEVMVFPQGKFSTASLALLKGHNYLAAVNSMDSVIPMDLGAAHGLTIADFLTPAISKYGNFPLFVRRYPGTVADFAFDLFLGKPALLVEHHHYFKNGYEKIQEFVQQINSLSENLCWTSLENSIKHTYLQRKISKENIECKIFSNHQIIFNQDNVEKKYTIYKYENKVESIKKVLVNGKEHNYSIENDYFSICIEIPSKNSIDIVIIYDNEYKYERERRSIIYNTKVCMRRYLSEARDNHMHRNEALFKYLYRVKKRLF